MVKRRKRMKDIRQNDRKAREVIKEKMHFIKETKLTEKEGNRW